MPTQLPPLNALRTFEAAARHGSFKKAADDLHVTPAAVSHQVNVLEDYLGVLLFERTKSGLVLTPAGRACLPKLSESFEMMRESMSVLSRFKSKETLTVSCPPSFSNRWLMPRLHRFLVRYPDLDVQVVSRMHTFGQSWNTREVQADTVRQWVEEVDVVLMLGDGQYPNLDVTRIMPLTLTPMLSPSLVSPELLAEPALLGALPLLHDDRGLIHGGQSYWRLWAQCVGMTPPDDAVGRHFSHAMNALEAAVDGLGAVVSSPALALGALESGRLVAPFAVLEDRALAYHAISGTARQSIEAFMKWLSEEAAVTNDALRPLIEAVTPGASAVT